MDEFDRREMRRMEAELARLRDSRWEERSLLEGKIREVDRRLDEHCQRSREKTTGHLRCLLPGLGRLGGVPRDLAASN
ncbi:MAG: hypothetical protein U0R26_11740 [Solirubrobacterales bacterium]